MELNKKWIGLEGIDMQIPSIHLDMRKKFKSWFMSDWRLGNNVLIQEACWTVGLSKPLHRSCGTFCNTHTHTQNLKKMLYPQGER